MSPDQDKGILHGLFSEGSPSQETLCDADHARCFPIVDAFEGRSVARGAIAEGICQVDCALERLGIGRHRPLHGDAVRSQASNLLHGSIVDGCRR